jgi:hypothetical protein
MNDCSLAYPQCFSKLDPSEYRKTLVSFQYKIVCIYTYIHVIYIYYIHYIYIHYIYIYRSQTFVWILGNIINSTQRCTSVEAPAPGGRPRQHPECHHGAIGRGGICRQDATGGCYPWIGWDTLW